VTSGRRQDGSRVRRKYFVISVGLFLLTLFTGIAVAEPVEGPDQVGSNLVPASEAALEAATAGADPIAIPTTNPEAASVLETEDIGRAEAGELLDEVFGSGLEASAEFFDDLAVKGFRSDYLAVVAPPEPEVSAGLISSFLPLRAEDGGGRKELVDLDLEEQAEGHLEPDNPLVEVEIPAQLGEGILLPESGVRITLDSAVDDRTVSSLSDSTAFYPNVEADTDFVAVPTLTGVETYTHLRSPDAPTEQVFRLVLPAGDQLEPRPDGGAQVVAPTGDPVLVIRPPSAIDAGGEPIPVTLQVDGDSLVLLVSPNADALYPILVDPLFESYTWGNGQGTSAGWKQYSDPGFSASWTMGGANVWSNEGATTPGNQGQIKYYVPRYWEDLQDVNRKKTPTSYIRKMTLWNLFYTIYQNNPFRNHPYMWMGLWDSEHETWISSYTRTAAEGALTNPSWPYEMKNEANNDDVKTGGFGLATSESWNGSRRNVYAGNATIEVTDDDYPGFAELSDQVQGWVNTGKKYAPAYKVGDNGLGIYQLRLRYPAVGGGPGEKITSLGCAGSAASPCPYSTVKPLEWDASQMAQGELNVRVDAVDPVGHWSSPGTVRFRIDHTKPDLGISGNLTEQATAGVNLLDYTLNYTASDGDDAPAAAQAPIGASGTGPGQLERPQGVAVDDSGNVWVTDRVNQRVVAYDKTGNYLRQIGTPGSGNGQINEPRGIAIGPNGNIWVAEAGTNKRIQQFTPTGTFVSKITNTGFIEPWGIAFGPQGEMWVTDQSGKAFVFNSSGVLTKTIANPVLKAAEVPYGIDIDRFGNAWIALQAIHQVVALSPSGSEVMRFGGLGTGPGQFRHPGDVAIAASGNILVTDDLNNRVQVFKPDGSFLREFGSAGSGNGQFNQPRGIDVGPDNSAVIADSGNKRLTRWSHADQDPQSGAAKVEIKVDGTSVKSVSPGCTTKNCAISGSWTLKADDFAAGQHKVEVIATDAVGISQTKTLDIETHGDFQAPAVSLSHSMTEQATLGTTRPTYALYVEATDPGSAEERKSGVAATTIKVDGKVVDSASPGCPAGGCSINRHWTLDSSSYAVGPHTVEVIATDAAGRSTTKTLEIEIARDTTAPTFELSNAFYTAPEGWLEQKTYNYNANAQDPNGYGVTSMTLKIDGTVVKSTSGPCQAGGCSRLLGLWGTTIDMSKYSGGAHPAELIATDGAGNTRKRTWTINVVPKGEVPPAEVDDTLEALEAVSEEVIVAPQSPEEPFYPGPEGESKLKEDSSGFHTVGAPAETALGDQPEDGFTIDTADGEVVVTPLGVEPAASPIESSSDISAISSNTGKTVDTIYRPIYDGAMTFQSIRTPTGTDEFSWTVNLRPGQYIEMADDRTAQVMSSVLEGPVFTITAIEAHDAVGSTVPTTLSASGSAITLKVHHKAGNPAVNNTPFVYPVIAGSGWQGGIVIHEVVGPPPTEPPVNPETIAFYETEVGPPEVVPASEADGGASTSSLPERRKKFARSVCGHSAEWVESQEGGEAIAEGKLQNGGLCGNGFDPVNKPGKSVVWRGTMRGAFFYIPGVRVRHRGSKDCTKGTPVESKIRFYAMKDAYECHFGPKTSDGNGGVSAGAGNYLRAQAHWELGERGRCWSNQPSEECDPPGCWMWQDRALELHLWSSGAIDRIRLPAEQAEPC
jgi:NHL repeat/6-bladed beta-propeller